MEKDLEPCHVLYFDKAAKETFKTWLPRLKSKPVLTLSDIETSAEEGVMLSILISRDPGVAHRMTANLAAVRQSGLRINSHLLKLCKVVGT
jgi:hypothetical protein